MMNDRLDRIEQAIGIICTALKDLPWDVPGRRDGFMLLAAEFGRMAHDFRNEPKN
jgi:hypothetical protein